MISARKLLPLLFAAGAMMLTGFAQADDGLKAGRFSVKILSGHSISATSPVAGDGKLKLNFKADGSVQVTAPQLGDFKGLWWVNPEGHVCAVATALWNGGHCYVGLVDSAGRLKAVRDAEGGPVFDVTVR